VARSPSSSPLPRPQIQRTKNSWVGGDEAWSETFACGVRSLTRQHSPQLPHFRAGLLVDSIVFVRLCGERERESSYMDWTYRGKKLVIISRRDSLLSTALCMADIQDASCFHTTSCRTNESKPCILISTLVRNVSSSQTSSSRRTFHSHVSICEDVRAMMSSWLLNSSPLLGQGDEVKQATTVSYTEPICTTICYSRTRLIKLTWVRNAC
jgi:hypothetical protein